MDYRRIITILIFIWPTLKVPAQVFDWSNLERFKNQSSYNTILGQNESGYFVLRSKYPDIQSKAILERYRFTMGQDYSKKLPAMRGYYFINAFVQNEGLIIWKSKYNSGTDKLDVYVQKLDNAGEISGDPMKIASASMKNYADNGDFVVQSDSRQYQYALAYSENAGNNKSRVTLRVFDRKMESVNNHQFVINARDDDYQMEKMLVDSVGNVFMLIRELNAAAERGSPDEWLTCLYVMALGSDSVVRLVMNFPDTYIHHPIMSLDELQGTLLVSGFYSLQGMSSSKGLLDFVYRIEPAGIIRHQFIPYSYNFVMDFVGEKAARDEIEPADFTIRKMVARSDGGYILFGEEYSISQQAYTYYFNGVAQVSSRSIYNYGKIMILSIDPSGKLEWSRVINKYQSSGTDYVHYSSYVTHLSKERIFLIFNDKLKGGGDVVIYQLNTEGELVNQSLFRNQGSFVAVIPQESRQIDASTILIPSAKDRKFAFLKISF